MRVPNFNCYRCPFGLEYPSCELFCARFVEQMIVEGSEGAVAGVIVEPYQANGGMVPAPEGYFEVLRELCDRQGCALIADEVQTAWARCGELFAMDHYGVEPDMIVLGKAFGGGFPMSARWSTSALRSSRTGSMGSPRSVIRSPPRRACG